MSRSLGEAGGRRREPKRKSVERKGEKHQNLEERKEGSDPKLTSNIGETKYDGERFIESVRL